MVVGQNGQARSVSESVFGDPSSDGFGHAAEFGIRATLDVVVTLEFQCDVIRPAIRAFDKTVVEGGHRSRGIYTKISSCEVALFAPEPRMHDQTFGDSVIKVSSAAVARIPRWPCEIVLPRIPSVPAGSPLLCSAILVANQGDTGSCPDKPRKNPATGPLHCRCGARYFAAPTSGGRPLVGDALAAPRFGCWCRLTARLSVACRWVLPSRWD